MIQARLVDDLRCPHCGCPEYRPVASIRPSWSGRQYQRMRCEHCGTEFYTRFSLPDGQNSMGLPTEYEARIDVAPAIEYVKMRCPECLGIHVPAYKKRGVVRYHKCTDCGHNFKSIEKI